MPAQPRRHLCYVKADPPPAWNDGTQALDERRAELARVEREIDEEVYRLYGIGAEDRAAIEAELAELVMGEAGEEGDAEASSWEDEPQTVAGEELDRGALARRWVSYAMGVVLGRFTPGIEGALGRGTFLVEVTEKLQALRDDDGLAVVETDYPDNLAGRVTRTLEVMVGEEQAGEIMTLAAGGKAPADYLKGEFFKVHVQQYRKRPVYWLLQSPRRLYSVYLFHERMTPDTLHFLRGAAYLGGALNGARSRQAELHAALASTAQGLARKKVERDLEAAGALLADLEAFDRNLAAVTAQRNERGEIVGWRPEIDDGVLINLAPLSSLLPSWTVEPRKAWEALAKGDYDWAHTAMRYWPDRVAQKCRTNKSYAIAQGLQVVEGRSR